MAKWRAARDTGRPLPAGEQAELETLIRAEVEASARRASSLPSSQQVDTVGPA